MITGRRLHLAVFGGLTLLHALMTAFMHYPSVVYDELTYLGFGRWFAGTGPIPNLFYGAIYGHFGYPVFIVPVFWLAKNFETQYHLILLANSLLLASMYFPLYFLVSRMSSAPERICVTVAAITSLYPAFLIYSNFTLTESLFVPLYLVCAVLFFRFCERSKIVNAVLLGLAAGSLYVVHNRALVICLALAGLIAFLALKGKLPVGGTLIVIAFIIATYVGNDYLKRAIHQMDSSIDFAGAKVLPDLRSPEAIKLVLLCVVGEALYLLISSFGLYALGFLYIWRIARGASGEIPLSVSATARFIIWAHLAVLLASSVFISPEGPLKHLDYLFLGRYNEGVLAPFLAGGLLYTYEAVRQRDRVASFGRVVATSIGVTLAGMLFLSPFVPGGPDALLGGLTLHANVIGLLGPEALIRTKHMSDLGIMSVLILALYAFLAVNRLRHGWTFIASTFCLCALVIFGGSILPAQHLSFNHTADTPARLSPLLSTVGGGEVSYDAATWNPFLFSEYQFFHPELRFHIFHSEEGKIPWSNVVIAGRKWKDAPGQQFIPVGTESLADNTLWIRDPALAGKLTGTESYIEEEVGNRLVPGIETSGVYPEEGDPASNASFRWTDGHGAFTVPLQAGDSPTTAELDIFVYNPTPVQLGIDDHTKVNATAIPPASHYSLPLHLAAGAKRVTIHIDSATFTPAPVNGYTRTLGVEVRSLILR